MSTKIYNAYKFNGKINELMSHLQQYRKKWIDYKTEKIKLIDGIEKISWEEIIDKIKESTEESDILSDYNINGSAVVYFYRDDIYVQTFVERGAPKFIDERFVDFHYQNQSDAWYEYDEKLTDEAKEIAAKDWEIREQVWDDLFKDEICTPQQAGLTYEFFSNYDCYNIADEVRREINERIAN